MTLLVVGVFASAAGAQIAPNREDYDSTVSVTFDANDPMNVTVTPRDSWCAGSSFGATGSFTVKAPSTTQDGRPCVFDVTVTPAGGARPGCAGGSITVTAGSGATMSLGCPAAEPTAAPATTLDSTLVIQIAGGATATLNAAPNDQRCGSYTSGAVTGEYRVAAPSGIPGGGPCSWSITATPAGDSSLFCSTGFAQGGTDFPITVDIGCATPAPTVAAPAPTATPAPAATQPTVVPTATAQPAATATATPATTTDTIEATEARTTTRWQWWPAWVLEATVPVP